MKKYFKGKYISISIIITVIIGLIFVPISITGYLARISSWTNIVSYVSNKMKACTECYRFSINWLIYIPELVITFFISLLVCNLLKKKGLIK